jgi:sorbitol-6-phosphate 2-dehydrogenase
MKEERREAARCLRKAWFEVTGERRTISFRRGAKAPAGALHLARMGERSLAARAARRREKGELLPEAFVVPELGVFTVGTASTLGELAGRIALVTGAASGLGRSIALGLAGAGACVGMADIDAGGARAAAREVGEGAVPIKCDVTSEAEVGRAVEAVLDRWGGLDVLVVAAGMAPAYPLVEFPVGKWRQALELNLTGYFLCAQAAARVMIRQGMGGSIIVLSSKSGLEASRDNSAYNATKAGEIHLARGWARELGEHGIRVNAVAPGNVFAGSRSWSPEYMRACARKYGIRPEEVIPYYVRKTALGQEIRGQDVADAVVFLCSERAAKITGQTLVVDGGQVMVR